MKKWAVSHINWSDYELSTIFVEAESWQQAALQHPKIAQMFPPDFPIPDDSQDAKQAAFDQDAMINIVEVV